MLRLIQNQLFESICARNICLRSAHGYTRHTVFVVFVAKTLVTHSLSNMDPRDASASKNYTKFVKLLHDFCLSITPFHLQRTILRLVSPREKFQDMAGLQQSNVEQMRGHKVATLLKTRFSFH